MEHRIILSITLILYYFLIIGIIGIVIIGIIVDNSDIVKLGTDPGKNPNLLNLMEHKQALLKVCINTTVLCSSEQTVVV